MQFLSQLKVHDNLRALDNEVRSMSSIGFVLSELKELNVEPIITCSI